MDHLSKEDNLMFTNWAKDLESRATKMRKEETKLPSRFQIGDEVIIKAKVKGVQFVDGKVSYCFWLDEELHTITSDHVRPADE